MPAAFKGRAFLLTYPQCQLDDHREFFNWAKSDLPHYDYLVVGRERHASGDPHIHAVVYFGAKSSFGVRAFDFIDSRGKTCHPNIKAVGRRVSDWRKCVDYCKKDSDWKEEGQERHADESVWRSAISATSRDDAIGILREGKPRDWVLNRRGIDYALDQMFPVQKASPPRRPSAVAGDCVPDALEEWLTGNWMAPRPERPRSLVLVGPSRLGKTVWARGLGSHAYVATSWDLSSFDRHFTSYVVFDDIPWASFSHYAKAFFGGQRDFTVSDKYRKKKRLAGGWPCIFLCNPEDFSFDMGVFLASDWGRQNVDVVRIEDKLF